MSASIKLPDDIKEYIDPIDQVQKKIRKLAELIRNSNHVVMFTGAGVSTSAGIQDFRGPYGYLTLLKEGIQSTLADPTRTRPTRGHAAIYKLCEDGYIKHLISQNTDGLHLRSGIPVTSISELHGNINIEKCPICERSYWRNSNVLKSSAEVKETHEQGRRHETVRQCENCDQVLQDTIINCFDHAESPHQQPLTIAQTHTKLCDLYIILGSSLIVYPANCFTQYVATRKKPVIIVNCQKTPYDDLAYIRIFAKIEDFLTLLCRELRVDLINTEVTDLELDQSFKDMIITLNATKKLDCVKERTAQLKMKSEHELMQILTERCILYKPIDRIDVRREHLVNTVVKKCRNTIYWV
ncbi:1831_t:CDS:2 [Diversispora eburnea]|uniref:Regulatory protein SIR2 homolog 7 n=3 Tax=Diversisporales TaxID=214509 RepID=A0A9N8V4R2_9GLOM|nr:1831_t:CDS:2 [Diversispora eburnea]